jgi:hypothetical protein
MLAGATQTLTATSSIVITTSNGGNVRIELNGKDLGLMGKEGERISEQEYTINSL